MSKTKQAYQPILPASERRIRWAAGDLAEFGKCEYGLIWDREGLLVPSLSHPDFRVRQTPGEYGVFAQGNALRTLVKYRDTDNAGILGTHVIHYIVTKLTGTGGISEFAAGLAKEWLAKWKTNTSEGNPVAANYPSTFVIGDMEFSSLNDVTEGHRDTQTSGGTAGAVDYMPARQCVVVYKGTPAGGRSGHGRVYMGPVGVKQSDSGILNNNVVGRSEGFWDLARTLSFTTAGGAQIATLGVYSPTASARGRAVVINPVTSVACRVIAGTQRRRRAVT